MKHPRQLVKLYFRGVSVAVALEVLRTYIDTCMSKRVFQLPKLDALKLWHQ